MSEPAVAPSSKDGDVQDNLLDAMSLSALLASRVCHDLINPVGALGSGLEVLADEGSDEGLRDAAMDLIRTSGLKSIALLKFARLAYGASGGRGVELPMEEAGLLLSDLYEWSKADLKWEAPAGSAPKEIVKTVMILAHYAADCVPRGGVVRVRAVGAGYVIEAEGRRALLQDDLVSALGGVYDELKPKFSPAYVAGVLVRSRGGSVQASRESEEKIVLRAELGE